MRVLVTGGAGFIASHLVKEILTIPGASVVVLDKLTYAGNLKNLPEAAHPSTLQILKKDVCETEPEDLHGVTHIVHAAAESHVDRSIAGPSEFIRTNVFGTFRLLEACRAAGFTGLFLHLSTDEVYGELGPQGFFTEQSRYAPNSPYSATKAASDHLVRAWAHTYGIRAIVANCSNNYGPRQYPEKLIPLTIRRCANLSPVLVHGDGSNVRDWLHVRDAARGLRMILQSGRPGETYNLGGKTELTNLQVVQAVCGCMDVLRPENAPHARLIQFTTDRPGNDRRYAIDIEWIKRRLGWRPEVNFNAGLLATVRWYLRNPLYWNAGKQKLQQAESEAAENAAHHEPEHSVAKPAQLVG